MISTIGRVCAVLGVIVLSVVHPPLIARADAEVPDWMLVKVTAGATGAEGVGVSLSAMGHLIGPGPYMQGFGMGTSGSGGYVAIGYYLDGPLGVTTNRGAGSLSVSVPVREGGSIGFGMRSTFDSLAPGEVGGVLVFGVGLQYEPTAYEPTVDRGSVSMSFATGKGSAALPAVEPDDDGIGVAAGAAAVGSSVHSVSADAGLAGGYLPFCTICSGGWQSPDGHHGSWTFAQVQSNLVVGYAEGDLSFAGPAGGWTWSWQGAGARMHCSFPGTGLQPYGAYAPLGDDWTLFRAPPVPATPFLGACIVL